MAGSLLLRRTLRVVLLLPATAAWWVAVVWRIRAVHPGLPLPVAALTLEAAALLAVTLALAAAGSHLAPERRGGVVAAPALLTLATAAFLLPAQVTLYAQPGSAAARTAPTSAGPCCSGWPWRPSPPPAATPPTASPSWLRGLDHWLTRGRAAPASRALRIA